MELKDMPVVTVEQIHRFREASLQEIAKLREELAAANQCTLGVGDGSGSLFVHGDYDSIKACQNKLLLLEEYRIRAEAAEAKLNAASAQEPVDFFCNATRFKADSNGVIKAWPELAGRWVALVPAEDSCHLRYAYQVPPADVQELQQKMREMSENLAAISEIHSQQKAALYSRIAELKRKLAEQQAELMRHARSGNCELTIHVEGGELNTLLAQAREEGRKEAVPDGWQIVPTVATMDMHDAGTEAIREAGGDTTYYGANECYKAMLADAPKPEVKP